MQKQAHITLGVLGIALGSLVQPMPTCAEETPAVSSVQIEAPASRHTAIGVDVGAASAVGLGGITLTRALGSHARIELGGGFGFSGLQLSLMPKLVLGGPRDHFVAGAGLSIAFPADSRSAAGHPIWLNVDAVGYEHLFDNGFAVSAALGVTGGLGGGQICVPSDGCEPQFLRDVTNYWGPQARAGVAYWF